MASYWNRTKMFLVDICSIDEITSLGNTFTIPLNSVYRFDTRIENQDEKNWVPFLMNEDLYLIYSFCPFVVLKVESLQYNRQIVNYSYATIDKDVQNTKIEYPDYDGKLSDIRGGSMAVRNNWDELGWIGIAHRRWHNDIYYSFFYTFLFDEQYKVFRLERMSAPFKIGNSKIEFASGLNIKDDDIEIYYGVDDKYCRRLTLSHINFLNILNGPTSTRIRYE